MSSTSKFAVLIPTRNRSDLAIAAARSVLECAEPHLRLLISDNSTAVHDQATLSEFCRAVGDARLTYLRPPEPLAMTEHWEWAMQQGLSLREVGHFVYLTDRSVFKPGYLQKLIELAREHPAQVISYDWVTVFDHLEPIFVEKRNHTGQTISVPAKRLLKLSSESLTPNCLPRMMNSCAPRTVVEAICKSFGSVFASISPDYNFCYRCLDVTDQILYWDVAAFVTYAIERSNGVSAIGRSTSATEDFKAQLSLNGGRRSFATPEPSFETFANYVMHEYALVKAESKSGRFPEIDLEKYFVRNASEIASNDNPELRKEMKDLLKVSGFSFPAKQRLSELRSKLSLRSRAKKIMRLEWPSLSSRVGPFDSLEEAINYASSIPLSDESTAYHLRMLED
jgi:hypothetical protein